MEIVRLRGDQFRTASVVLARAFQEDPAWAWVLPDAERRAALLPWLFRTAFEVTEADTWTTAGEIVGCARWLPPGKTQVHMGAMLRAFVATPLRVREATPRFLAYGRAVEAARMEAVPEPHWYLAGIGVDPPRQGEGIGSALMAPGIDASARDGVPCVLVTNTERNVEFYRHRGFEIVQRSDATGQGPPAWVMRRSPQPEV